MSDSKERVELLLPVTCRGNPSGGNPALAAKDSARDKPVAQGSSASLDTPSRSSAKTLGCM